MRSPDEARWNNADVLILNGEFPRYLWYRRLGTARFIVFPADGFASREARLASVLHRREKPFQVKWGSREFFVIRQEPGAQVGARHYISQCVGLEAFPTLLDERNISYAVLRWFDDLPDLDAGEDLDVLVSDRDLESFVTVLDDEPGSIPIDLYSESGRPGSDFHAMAYYPPALSAGILERAIRLPSGYRAPSPHDHFLSLAYHALYHKGLASGLRPSEAARTRESEPEHDYEQVLSDLALRQGIHGPLTMDRLDELLAAAGWRPPRDMLARLSHHNSWVRERFFSNAVINVEPPLLSVFLLRDRASDPAAIALAQAVVEDHGFEILHVHHLEPEAAALCGSEIRGGNWGQGPFATSGGRPAVALVALDAHPETPTPAQHREHPGLTNAHTLESKLEFRDRLMSGVDLHEQFNPMHSSDSDEDAWHYLQLAHPNVLADVMALVEERRAAGPSIAIGEGRDRQGSNADRKPSPTTRTRAIGVFAIARTTLGRLRRRAVHIGASVIRACVTWRVSTVRRRGPKRATR